jgi:hypothetical protein
MHKKNRLHAFNSLDPSSWSRNNYIVGNICIIVNPYIISGAAALAILNSLGRRHDSLSFCFIALYDISLAQNHIFLLLSIGPNTKAQKVFFLGINKHYSHKEKL